MIVEHEIVLELRASFSRRSIVMNIDFLIFYRSPKPLCKDVVSCTSFAIHANLDIGLSQYLLILWTGKMTSLVTLPDRWRGHRQGSLHGSQHEWQGERLVQLAG